MSLFANEQQKKTNLIKVHCWCFFFFVHTIIHSKKLDFFKSYFLFRFSSLFCALRFLSIFSFRFLSLFFKKVFKHLFIEILSLFFFMDVFKHLFNVEVFKSFFLLRFSSPFLSLRFTSFCKPQWKKRRRNLKKKKVLKN